MLHFMVGSKLKKSRIKLSSATGINNSLESAVLEFTPLRVIMSSGKVLRLFINITEYIYIFLERGRCHHVSDGNGI